MTALPKCKLCGSCTVEIQTFECMKHMCPNKQCTLNNVLFRLDQWRTLMGDDRDALRYRWLRHHVSGREYRALGINYSTTDQIDSLIDEAMKEQQNG